MRCSSREPTGRLRDDCTARSHRESGAAAVILSPARLTGGVPCLFLTTMARFREPSQHRMNFGRDAEIRTRDPLTPSQVRYQAALHPDAKGEATRTAARVASRASI